MGMPGFTAEASIDQVRGNYWIAPGNDSRSVFTIENELHLQLNKDDLTGNGASCGKLTGFGNVICSKCSTGPFGTKCTDYVCDKDGNNCKPTKPTDLRQLTVLRLETANRSIFIP